MRDGGRVAAAIEVLEAVMTRHQPVKDALRDWGKAHRFAGSSDRAWISGLVLDALRRRSSIRDAMSEDTPRALVIGALGFAWGYSGTQIAEMFEGDEHAPEPPTAAERGGLLQTRDDAPLNIAADIPDWLETSFSRAYGQDAAAEGQAMAGRAPVDLRVNALKSDTERALAAVAAKLKTVAQSDLTLDGLRIPETDPRAKAPGADAIPAYGKGWVEVQDIGSQLAALAAGDIAGAQVLDYCAGAGGKTLALSALMENTGQLYAWDYDGRRLKAIWPRLQRAGVRNVQVRDGKEAETLGDLEGKLDCVFIDAPCSGSGTWRRRPDSKWRVKPEALKRRMAEQDEVLSKAWRFVKPGGRLVYVTCSVLPDENEDRVANFLEGREDFTPVPASEAMAQSGRLADGAKERLAKLEGRFGAIQLTPLRTGTDGFYVCVLERAENRN
ncbi:RsmB/NOP family class I SAM-dependent RNA methyltransferase [Maricaulaceae bacterium EIL42A08]|nr:RsmB/NOP family class I SAM-dependent RNA methyltransferase [Maricaulaceae bacterium EIL42A08]